MEGNPPFIPPNADPVAPIISAWGVLHFAFLARADRMLQTASGDDPKIKQKLRPDGQESPQDGSKTAKKPKRTPKRTPNKPPNHRHIKVECDMMIVQKIPKSL